MSVIKIEPLKETLATYGGFKKGCYRPVIRINYPLIAPELLGLLHHPLAKELLQVQRNYLHISTKSGKLTKDDKEMYAKNKLKSRELLAQISKEKTWDEPMLLGIKNVIETHMEVLKPFGRVFMWGAGSFFFAPRKKHMDYLQESKYFNNTNSQHVCDVEYIHWMVVFNKSTYIMKDSFGLSMVGMVSLGDVEKYGSAMEDPNTDLSAEIYRNPITNEDVE